MLNGLMSILAMLMFFQLTTGTASDYAIPMTYRVSGKVVVGLDQPAMVVVTLKHTPSGTSRSAQSFSNGTFRFDGVTLGQYSLEVVDARFNLFEMHLYLREPSDTSKEFLVRLTPNGESGAPPTLDDELYSIDAKTLASMPAKAVEHYNLGVSALRNPMRNNPPDAHFKRAIAEAPEFYEAHLVLGLQSFRQKKNGDAIKMFERAAAIRPSEPRPLSMLGELYWTEEKFQDVVETFAKLAELNKMTARDEFHLGSALYRLNRLREAHEHLLAAINTGDDKDPAPFLQLHNVFLKVNQPLPALEVLEDYLKLFPADANHAAMSDRARQLRERLKLPPRPPGF